MIRARYILFLIVIFLMNENLSPQKNQINPETFIKEVQKQYTNLNNFVIEFSQEIFSYAIEGKQELKGRLYYLRPNNYRVEINEHQIVCDGEVVYNYSKKARRVVITNFEKNFFSPQNLLVEVPKYSKVEFIGMENLNNKNLYKFSLLPSPSNPEFKSMKLWIDEAKTIWKIQTEDWAGNYYSFVIHKFNPDQDLKSDLFKFKIPSGVKVVDLR
ncbi:MAG: LolA family protein [Ignavibacteria bacterium]